MYTNEHAGQHDQKHPWLAVLLSSTFTGAGQIYAGRRARGIFFILFTLVLYITIVLGVYGFLMTESAQDARTDNTTSFLMVTSLVNPLMGGSAGHACRTGKNSGHTTVHRLVGSATLEECQVG